MNILQAKQVLLKGYDTGLPVLFLSSPGLGKSQVVLQASRELGEKYKEPFGMIEIRGASSSPAELATVKYIKADEVCDAEQAWVPTAQKVKEGLCPARGIIFCDEISASMDAVISTLQRLFLDRKLGGQTLAKGWYVVAAGNRAKDKSASRNLSRAFINRCIAINVDPDPDVFHSWGLENDIDYRVLAYVRFKPDCLADGLTITRSENQAFCSPRSLEMVSKNIKAEFKLDPAIEMEINCGLLGDGRGSEFNGFVQIMDDLPDIGGIIKDPENYAIPTKINVAWATVGALSHRANKDNISDIMKYVTRMSTEISVIAISDLAKKEKAVFKTKEFRVWSSDKIKFAM